MRNGFILEFIISHPINFLLFYLSMILDKFLRFAQ